MSRLKLTVAVIDDEAISRQGLITRLNEIENVEVVAECASAEQAMEAFSRVKPDLMLVDINMPKISGIELVSQLLDENRPMVIFVTAFDQYAVKAFELHAVDYLLKPVSTSRLSEALELARQRLQQQLDAVETKRLLEVLHELTHPPSVESVQQGLVSKQRYTETLSIKDGAVTTRLPVKAIQWVDAAGDYMCIHADDRVHVLRMTMKKLEALLDPEQFQRIHKSTLVNVSLVHKIRSHMNGEYQLELLSGTILKMSRSYKRKIKFFV